MNREPRPAEPAPGAPRIPPPPAGARRRRGADPRWLIWAGALAVGAALGLGAYRWIQGVDAYFDDWLARVTPRS